MAEILDLGGPNVMRSEHIRTVTGHTPGDTRLIAYGWGFTSAVIERAGTYFRIEPINDWYPEEITASQAMLYECDRFLPDTPHLRRKGHLDQIIGKVRRQFVKSGQSVSQSIVQAVPRSEISA